MIFSTLHSKDTNEDPKTSSIVGGLLLLPDQIFYKVVNRACGNILPLNNGSILSFEFWPHWPADETSNTNFVEPDVVIHCEYRDIIIEAKYSVNSPASTYINRQGVDSSECLFIAKKISMESLFDAVNIDSSLAEFSNQLKQETAQAVFPVHDI